MKTTNLERTLNSISTSVALDYRNTLILNKASGKLASSVEAEVKRFGDTFKVILHLEDYWKWLENGRPPGKMPPVQSILEWVKVKPVLPTNKITQEQLAFLIARKIGREGTKAKHYLKDSLNKQDNITERIAEAFREDIRETLKENFKIKK